MKKNVHILILCKWCNEYCLLVHDNKNTLTLYFCRVAIVLQTRYYSQKSHHFSESSLHLVTITRFIKPIVSGNSIEKPALKKRRSVQNLLRSLKDHSFMQILNVIGFSTAHDNNKSTI